MVREQMAFDLVEVPVQFDTNYLVTKSNLLIESSYKLSTLESKLILTLFSNVQPNDDDINTYVFQIQPFVEMLELKGKSKYKDLRDITKGLMEKVYEIRIGDTIHQVSWLSHVAYNEGAGTISMRFDEFWKPYILQLRHPFTSYKLGNITKLKSSYSIRLYEVLKQWQKVGHHTFAVSELRSLLGLPDNMYKLYANFKQRILLKAQKELQKTSDLVFDFEEIKEGRSVKWIAFTIRYNPHYPTVSPVLPSTPSMNENSMNERPIDEEGAHAEVAATTAPSKTVEQELREQLIAFGVNQKMITALFAKYEVNRISANIDYTKSRISLGSVTKPAGYVKRAIEHNYADSRKKSKKTTPTRTATPKTPPTPKKQEKKGLDVEVFLSYLYKKREIMIKLGDSDVRVKEQMMRDLEELIQKPEFQDVSDEDKKKIEQWYQSI